MTRRNRYGAWDGGPDPLAAAVRRAGRGRRGRPATCWPAAACATRCATCCAAGPTGRRGLDDLLARARRMRREAMRRGQLDGAVTRAQQLLDQAIAAERDELAPPRRRRRPVRRVQLGQPAPLDRAGGRGAVRLPLGQRRGPRALPADPRRAAPGGGGAAVPRAASEALSDPAAQQAAAEMMRDLNELLERHARGEDTTDQFAEFMRQHGDYFPENPANVDELVDAAGPAGGGRRAADALAVAAAARGAVPADGAGARRRRARPARWPRSATTCARCGRTSAGAGASRCAAASRSGTARRPARWRRSATSTT